MPSATDSKVGAYKTHQRQNESERDIEAHALLSCASQLEAARRPDIGPEIYTDALKRNQRLWTIFQVALCDPDNPLPHELKAILLNLSRFVDKMSFRAIGDYRPELLKSLIDINRHIAAGLSKKPKTEATAATAPSAGMPAGNPVMTSA